MKNCILSICLLSSGALIAMEDSDGLSKEIMENSTKQYQLLHALECSNKPGAKKASLHAIKKLLTNESVTEKEPTAKIDLNFQYPEKSNQTPLMLALAYGNTQVIQLLLSIPGINAGIKNRDDLTALHFCLLNPANMSPLQILLEKGPHLSPPIDLNQRGQAGITALWNAVHRGNLEAVKLLCAHAEVNPNMPAEKYAFHGNYPLHEAMKGLSERELQVIRLLADKGALMDCTNEKGQTPLAFASSRLRSDHVIAPNRVLALLALGATSPDGISYTDMIVTSPDGKIRRPPLNLTDGEDFLNECFRAAVQGTRLDDKTISEMFKFYALKRINDPNTKDKVYGMTALMWAAARGHLALAKLLLKHPNIDVAATDNFGDTALHYAARNGHTELVQLLLDRSDLMGSIKNSNGKTALDLAKLRDHKPAGRVLYKDRVTYRKLVGSLSGLSENAALPRLPEEIAELILYFRRIAADPKKTKPKGPVALISNKINKLLKKQ